MAGSITVEAADKATQFIQVADSFHLPLIFLTDNPGVLAGSSSEKLAFLDTLEECSLRSTTLRSKIQSRCVKRMAGVQQWV